MISRFRSPKEQKAILERVEAGKNRHSHRHPSGALEGYQFQDLGLLVVDEDSALACATRSD